MSHFDIAIIGAGMAGASLAAELSDSRSVLLLEAEDQPGYHSTGRSAALWHETYGGPAVQPLTSASGPFLRNPPADFSERSFLVPRGALNIGRAEHVVQLDAMERDFAGTGVVLERLDRAAIAAMVPGLKEGWNDAIWEPDCADIDVGALHGAFLGKARHAGVEVRTRAGLRSARYSAGRWALETAAGAFTSTLLVNAAGAWADDVARMASVGAAGIQPYRRTMVQLRVDPPSTDQLPLVRGIDGSFYFRPESGGRIWLSPHDETPTDACDAAPEELDVAIAIARMEEVVDWKVKSVERKWAGLRSFAPDRLPVIGRDAMVPEFFWFAGQGGFGIQTAPAAAWLARALILGQSLPPVLSGVDPARYYPDRLA